MSKKGFVNQVKGSFCELVALVIFESHKVLILKCSIVIRAFNEEKHIGRLLTGIMQQTLKDVEIILVDSGSTDNTLLIASKYQVKVVHIDPKEFTFGRSLNVGMAVASGDFAVITSAHCYPVYKDWLKQLLVPLEQDPRIAISYGKQRGGETNHYSEQQFFKRYFPEVSVHRQSNPYSHNANAAIRRSIWEKQPYNENLTGLEDLAWSSWAKEEGYEISYVAEAEVIHIHDERPAQIYNRYRREAIAMKQILPNSKFNFQNFFSMFLSMVAADLLQSRRENLLRKNWLNIFLFRFLQYWGTYMGYCYSGAINAHLHRKFYYPPNILSVKSPISHQAPMIEYQDLPD